jgi:hypothetical protein
MLEALKTKYLLTTKKIFLLAVMSQNLLLTRLTQAYRDKI